MIVRRPVGVALLATLVCSVVGVAGYRYGRAHADGAPTTQPLYYGGVLEDGGRAVEGMRSVTVRLWDAMADGTAVCTTVAPTTSVSGGRFRVALDAACATAVQANPNLWAEVIVDSTTFARQKLGAVPYAIEAGRAAGASGALERRLMTLESQSGRQIEIGPSPVSSGSSQSCATTFTVFTHIPAVTFVARRTGRYRISASFAINGPQQEVRIGSPMTLSFLSQNIFVTYSGNPVGEAIGIVSLTQGQTYTFHVEYRNIGSITTSCTVSGIISPAIPGAVRPPASTPMIVQQLD